MIHPVAATGLHLGCGILAQEIILTLIVFHLGTRNNCNPSFFQSAQFVHNSFCIVLINNFTPHFFRVPSLPTIILHCARPSRPFPN